MKTLKNNEFEFKTKLILGYGDIKTVKNLDDYVNFLALSCYAIRKSGNREGEILRINKDNWQDFIN